MCTSYKEIRVIIYFSPFFGFYLHFSGENASLAVITRGNLNEVVDVNSSSEFASLSRDINKTVDTLKKYITDAENRINEELEFARSIQSSALPKVFKTLSVEKALPFVRERIAAFAGNAEQFDDITMLGFEFKHRQEKQS